MKQWDVVKEKSTFEVQLGKSGWLRIFGDEHFIDVTGYEFKIAFDPAAPAQGSSVEIMIPSRGLRVRDPHLSAETRLEVQAKMEGPEVLDLANFREIRFKSKRVTAGDPSLYRVDGDLTIRASSRPMAFDLTLER
ncbi:MAG: YceI family protein, partial [Candidatus Acidiferrales bacterium]